MSKSVGNVIDPFTMTDAYGVDQFRYFFLREVPFGQDGNYSHEAIVNRINADLANDLGNLAQRSLTMINKQLGGVLPRPGAFSDTDNAFWRHAVDMIGAAREHMKTQQLHQVLSHVWAVVADANRYFASEAPWALAKTDPARQGTVLYVTAEVLRQVGILCQPFMPASAGRCSTAGCAGEREAVRPAGQADKRIAPEDRIAGPGTGISALRRAGSREGVTCFVDSHCHLDFPDFKDELDDVWWRGPGRPASASMVTISTRSAQTVRSAGHRRPFFRDVFRCSVGTHRITP